MKKFVLLLVVMIAGVAVNNAYAQATKTEKKDPQTEQRELKARFEKLGKDIDQRLAVAESDLKKANADTKAEMQKAVDKLKKEADEVKRGSERAGREMKEDWATVKKELNDMADRIERDLKK